MASGSLLIGDIGGTNARFALAGDDAASYSKEQTLQCADFPSADLAISAYLERAGAERPEAICLAVAGPIVDGTVRFTNNNWTIDTDHLRNDFSGAPVRLLNDFEATAYSIPALLPADCLPVGLPAPAELGKEDYTVAIVGPGTGLGAAGLMQRQGQLVPVVGEAGHLGFAPETQVQMELLGALRERFDRVSDERLLSGPGLQNIYWALGRMRDEKNAQLSAAEIFAQAGESSDSTAGETVQLFFEILGQVAGNLALALGATEGVYIGGGIVRRDPKLIVNSRFRTGFERKGRHRSLVEEIPTQVILHEHPGLIGANYCVDRMIADR